MGSEITDFLVHLDDILNRFPNRLLEPGRVHELVLRAEDRDPHHLDQANPLGAASVEDDQAGKPLAFQVGLAPPILKRVHLSRRRS